MYKVIILILRSCKNNYLNFIKDLKVNLFFKHSICTKIRSFQTIKFKKSKTQTSRLPFYSAFLNKSNAKHTKYNTINFVYLTY